MSAKRTNTSVNIEYLKTIGYLNNGDNGRGFSNPSDLVVASDGRIFVLNRCDPERSKAIRVGVCNIDEDYLYEFGDGFGDGDTQFGLPVSIALDNSGRLHITDEYFHRVTVFNYDGEFLDKWGVYGNNEGQFNGPSGIVFDSEDNVYIVDQNNHRVQKFTSGGRYILEWGGFGREHGQFNMPWGVDVDVDNNVYIADWRNDRIQKFASDGKFIAAFGSFPKDEVKFSRPSGVAVDDEGYIYVADWGNEAVQVLNPDGRFICKMRGQATLSKWAEDFFDSNLDEKIERDRSNLMPTEALDLTIDPYRVSSLTESYFWGPRSVTIDSNHKLYVTESNRHRFQVYQIN